MNTLSPIPVSEYERDRTPRFVVTNTNTIMATHFDPIRWVVPDYLPEGLSILAGRQKLGKTWLALDMAIAVAAGGAAMARFSAMSATCFTSTWRTASTRPT